MSEKSRRSKLSSAVHRRKKPTHTNPSPLTHRRPATPRGSFRRKSVRVLKRCSSAPAILSEDCAVAVDGEYRESMPDLGAFFRPKTFFDVFASSPSLLASFSPRSHAVKTRSEGYQKDSKVVVNVTVEGSPGPIRAMVKLGSSVEETIKLVVDKYSAEGRTPKLVPNVASSFELHHSYFSLECLDKSELMGDVGSRSFYLRKSSSKKHNDEPSASVTSEITTFTPPPILHPGFLIPGFIARKFCKIARRTRRLWRVLICMR